MIDVAEMLVRMADHQQTVAVAESLTGGLVLAALTDVAGASQVVRGGMVVYATDAKTLLAGVPPELLQAVGPVDSQIARALADGARARLGATFGLGITGVAGPSGQAGHAVGEVDLAVAGPLGVVTATRDFGARSDRATIRLAACEAALSLLDAVSRESLP